MKITKQGKLPELVADGKCNNCNCEITATLEEWSKKGSVGSIECPTEGCGSWIYKGETYNSHDGKVFAAGG